MSRNGLEYREPPKLPLDHYTCSEIYTNEEIFAEEREKLLSKIWKFACHESEVPNAGDYRTLTYAGKPLVVVRGRDQKVRTFFNICSHRSSLIAREPSGNVQNFVCFFHLWAYDLQGNCVRMTRPEGYERHGPTKSQSGLREVRTETKYGLVFINLDDQADSLDAFVGTALDHMAEPLRARPLEVFHFHTAKISANWKQWQETNMELYHEWGHIINRATAIRADDNYFDRVITCDDNAHLAIPSMVCDYEKFQGWQNRDADGLPGVHAGDHRATNLFPNTLISLRGTCFRIDTSTPIAPGLTLVEFRGLGLAEDTPEQRASRVKDHNAFWGPLGRNLPEDIHFVEAVSTSIRDGAACYGVFARHENLGPNDDEPMRAYYRAWSKYMRRSAADLVELTEGRA